MTNHPVESHEDAGLAARVLAACAVCCLGCSLITFVVNDDGRIGNWRIDKNCVS